MIPSGRGLDLHSRLYCREEWRGATPVLCCSVKGTVRFQFGLYMKEKKLPSVMLSYLQKKKNVVVFFHLENRVRITI